VYDIRILQSVLAHTPERVTVARTGRGVALPETSPLKWDRAAPVSDNGVFKP